MLCSTKFNADPAFNQMKDKSAENKKEGGIKENKIKGNMCRKSIWLFLSDMNLSLSEWMPLLTVLALLVWSVLNKPMSEYSLMVSLKQHLNMGQPEKGCPVIS